MKMVNGNAPISLEWCCGLACNTLYPWKREPKQVQLKCVRLELCVNTCAQTSGLPSCHDVYLCFGDVGFGIMSMVNSLDTDVDINTLTTLIRWKVLVCHA